jgi:hypothetical protein
MHQTYAVNNWIHCYSSQKMLQEYKSHTQQLGKDRYMHIQLNPTRNQWPYFNNSPLLLNISRFFLKVHTSLKLNNSLSKKQQTTTQFLSNNKDFSSLLPFLSSASSLYLRILNTSIRKRSWNESFNWKKRKRDTTNSELTLTDSLILKSMLDETIRLTTQEHSLLSQILLILTACIWKFTYWHDICQLCRESLSILTRIQLNTGTICISTNRHAGHSSIRSRCNSIA